jgi:hypothetical protein
MRRNCLSSRSSFAGLGAALATMPTASMPADCLSYATGWSFPRARNVQRTGNKRRAVQDASRRLGESVFEQGAWAGARVEGRKLPGEDVHPTRLSACEGADPRQERRVPKGRGAPPL